jgi:hypothetical protein
LIKKTRYIKLSRQEKAKNSKNRKLNGTNIRLRLRPKTTEILRRKTEQVLGNAICCSNSKNG